ncbi:MAG: phage holin [Coprobacillus sp.]
MKTNWKIRFKNPVFWIQVIGAGLLTALSYYSMQPNDLVTWPSVGHLIVGVVMNPYLLFSVLWSIWCAYNDPTTTGLCDSKDVLEYEEPKK